jgi:hypothetical protein
MGLGGLHTVDLAKAPVLAWKCRTLLLDGKDPIEARKAVRLADPLQRARAMTFVAASAESAGVARSAWFSVGSAHCFRRCIDYYAPKKPACAPLWGLLQRLPGRDPMARFML